MTFDEMLDQAIEMLQRRGRVSYRALKAQFHLDDDLFETLKEELIEVHQLAIDQDGKVLVWTGEAPTTPEPSSPTPTTTPVEDHTSPPLSYTPKYLTDKILTSRSALEGERKQVTVLFAGYPLKAGHYVPQWFRAPEAVASSDGHSGHFE